MLATEPDPSGTTQPAPRASILENWSANERMRHVPTIAWMVQKLDGDVRRRIDALWLPYSDLPASDPRHAALEAGFRSLCKSLDRVGDVARHHRGHPHPPVELGNRVQWSLGQAIANLKGGDSDSFGRRFPFQTFERSNAEPLWAAMLATIQQVQKLTELVRDVDPQIDEKVYEGLVTLVEPLRRDPIA